MCYEFVQQAVTLSCHKDSSDSSYSSHRLVILIRQTCHTFLTDSSYSSHSLVRIVTQTRHTHHTNLSDLSHRLVIFITQTCHTDSYSSHSHVRLIAQILIQTRQTGLSKRLATGSRRTFQIMVWFIYPVLHSLGDLIRWEQKNSSWFKNSFK